MINKKLTELQEQLDFDYDLVSVELDTCSKRLRYLSSNDITDAIQKDAFDAFYNRLKNDEAVVVSFDNNTDMYEVGDECLVVVLHENLKGKYIIFDIQDAKKVENLVFSFDKSESSYKYFRNVS